MKLLFDERCASVLVYGSVRQGEFLEAPLAPNLSGCTRVEVCDRVFLEDHSPAFVRTCNRHVFTLTLQVLFDCLVGCFTEHKALGEGALNDFYRLIVLLLEYAQLDELGIECFAFRALFALWL